VAPRGQQKPPKVIERKPASMIDAFTVER